MKTSHDTAYLRLYEEMRDEIVKGSWKYGMKIPSKRTTAAEKGLSVITVEHAYQLLADEGYIEARQRSGYFVIYRDGDLFPFAPAEQQTHIQSSVEDDVFPYSVLATAVRKVLTEYGERILERTEWCGCEELRNAIAAYLGRSRGIHVRPEQIVISSGAESLYGFVVQMLGRHRIYGIEDPGYERILQMYRAAGVRCDRLKLGENGILSEELRRTPASVLHVTPYRSYPTLRSTDASKRMEYIRWAQEHHAYIIEDDYDSEFTVSRKAEQTLFSLEPEHHVIYMNTFTKTIAPSVRAGYMILPSAETEALQEKMKYRSCSVSALSQFVIAELIGSGSFERHINRIRRKRRKMQKGE